MKCPACTKIIEVTSEVQVLQKDRLLAGQIDMVIRVLTELKLDIEKLEPLIKHKLNMPQFIDLEPSDLETMGLDLFVFFLFVTVFFGSSSPLSLCQVRWHSQCMARFCIFDPSLTRTLD